MTPIPKKPSIPGTEGKPICHVQPLEEANTNLIAHNNDRLPLRTSSLNEETNTNLIAHNNSGYSFCLMYKTFSIFSPVSRVYFQIVASFLGISLTQGISTRGMTKDNHHIF